MAKYEIYECELRIATDNEKQSIDITHRGHLTPLTIKLINDLLTLQDKFDKLLLEKQQNYDRHTNNVND